MMTEGITIRRCETLDDYRDCMLLQNLVWGDGPAEQVPAHVFIAAAKTGGQIFGAYDGDVMVAYLFALIGWDGLSVFLHSHMTGVHPDYQDKGIGRSLKLRQREDALERGIDRIVWTFDPFKARNAHFNLVRLGALARKYVPNLYGITTSYLDGGLPTDRLVAEWWIKSPRVLRALEGCDYMPGDGAKRIVVPAGTPTVVAKALVRRTFATLFDEGYVATFLEKEGENIVYVLEHPGDGRAGC